ncbi:MAG TPA: polysaccharide deacetylase family protein, partial [Geobacteraceae bacterium]|nr:polysaccharide deacetylase family protein [Geobacteraceae bacterium]
MEMTKRKILLTVVCLILAAVAAIAAILFKGKSARIEPAPGVRLADLIANPGAKPVAEPFLSTFREVLTGYRKIIVLFTDERTLSPLEREHVNRVGHAIYYENQEKISQLDTALEIVASSRHNARFSVLDELLGWIESGSDLYDADRLAFRENLLTMQKAVAADQTLPAVKLHKRITDDLAALDEIETLYDKELKQIFQRFGERAIEVRRERWEDYVAGLKKMFTREQILKEYGVIVPAPQVEEGTLEKGEINGRSLPPKTLVLTFDDGPHGRYSEEISAILDQYNISGVFFELGGNLGTLDANNKPKLGRLAGVSRKLSESGHALGNHSFSHAQLSKANDAALRSEIARTDILLKAVSGSSPRLFRFPYGARTKRSLALLEGLGLRSVYWNIDSLDWADPVPNSIADRVLRSVDAEQRGVLLFHDINQ